MGVGLLLYPSVSNLVNSLRQTEIITDYNETIAALPDERLEQMWEDAREYNATLKLVNGKPALTSSQQEKYKKTLDVTGTGVMGYVEIPIINVRMPIYHGVDDGVLEVAAGHLDWTSLPVGGEGTHCVLSGHRGLPSARLFTDLPELKIGDIFVIKVLDRTLTYRINQILTVEPKDIEKLRPTTGHDYCTLVTCTPYGINTHRLLVRGERVKNGEDAWNAGINDDALVIDRGVLAIISAIVAMIIILLRYVALNKRKK